MNKHPKYIFLLLLCCILSACSLTKYVPQDAYLVRKVSIETDNPQVKPSELKPYLKQVPPHRTFGLIPFPLYLYNLSGQDTTRWINRFLRRAGTPPEIYDATKTERTEREMQKMLVNKGYMQAEVTSTTKLADKKSATTYHIRTGAPKRIASLDYEISDSAIARFVLRDTTVSELHVGTLLDRNKMELERVRITKLLRNKGYWAFNKSHINYAADTSAYHDDVNLRLRIDAEQVAQDRYHIGRVYFYTNYDALQPNANTGLAVDTVRTGNYFFISGENKYLRESTLLENCYLKPGSLYSDRAVDQTYAAFSRLQILKNIQVRFTPSKVDPDAVDCYILLTPGNKQNIQTDLEGTNSDGDFGFSAAVSYQHYNVFKGSETFGVKVRGGYENITGNIDNLVSNNFTELGGELSLTFPKFLFPMMDLEMRRRLRASTEFTASYNFQRRPEYTRVIAGGSWKYKWQSHKKGARHILDFMDVNYVYLPYRSETFIDSVINNNPITYTSYKDHLITRTGYNFYRSNFNPSKRFRDVYTLRINTELAGNILYGLANLMNFKKVDNDYTLFGLRFDQYWKLDADYAYTKVFTPKNALAFRVAAGIGIPYGNSDVLPFEKRYYAGGANSVRGWSVRTLGPGIYKSENPSFDYFNQSGDIRFDASVEYRTRLFWKLEMAAFIDAGNVWTIRDYASQEGGAFQFNTFYKQIAMAWGMGMRLDFDFFLVRLDLGFKAYSPSLIDTNPWVLNRPFAKGNQSLHFAVGYPF